MFGLRNTTSATPSHRGADAALVAHSSGRRGRASLLQGEPCLPESVWLTIRPERSLAASEKSVRWLSVTPLVTLDHVPRCHPMSGTGRPRRGLSRRRTVSTSKALHTRAARDHALVGPVPICFRPGRDLALQHDLCERCSTCVRGRGGGADEALFRRLLDPRRACPEHVWASG